MISRENKKILDKIPLDHIQEYLKNRIEEMRDELKWLSMEENELGAKKDE